MSALSAKNKVAKLRCKHGIYPTWTCDLCWTPDSEFAVYGLFHDPKTYWEKTAPWYYRTFRKNHNGVFISVKSTRNPLKILYWRWRYERIPEL